MLFWLVSATISTGIRFSIFSQIILITHFSRFTAIFTQILPRFSTISSQGFTVFLLQATLLTPSLCSFHPPGSLSWDSHQEMVTRERPKCGKCNFRVLASPYNMPASLWSCLVGVRRCKKQRMQGRTLAPTLQQYSGFFLSEAKCVRWQRAGKKGFQMDSNHQAQDYWTSVLTYWAIVPTVKSPLLLNCLFQYCRVTQKKVTCLIYHRTKSFVQSSKFFCFQSTTF